MAGKGKPGRRDSAGRRRRVNLVQVLSDSAKNLPNKRHRVLLFGFATLFKTAQRDSRDHARAGWTAGCLPLAEARTGGAESGT
jgi:hypothetical protein